MDKTIRYLNGKFPLKKKEIKTELQYPKENKFALLVAILLSASSSDKQVNKATKELFKQAYTPKNMVKLGKNKIYDIIKSVGIGKRKAHYIYDLSKEIIKLKHIPNSLIELVKLPGIGNKTAGVYLINARLFDKNIKEVYFPVDTHVKQFAIRHNLTTETNPYKIQKIQLIK